MTIDEKITTLFCVATAPLGPDVQRVIWKEVRDDDTRRTLSDIWYFIQQFIVYRVKYPDSMTCGDGSFTPSTVNMVNTWVEFLKKRATREIRPDITIGTWLGQRVVSAEKEDLFIDILNDELQIGDFIVDDNGKRQWFRLTDEETYDLFQRQYQRCKFIAGMGQYSSGEQPWMKSAGIGKEIYRFIPTLFCVATAPLGPDGLLR
tara:strand:+ start:276 stop:887 length:612 start_codon:yes stop_codon:yes gene_type:complete